MVFNPQLNSEGHFVENVRGLYMREKQAMQKRIPFCDSEEGDKSQWVGCWKETVKLRLYFKLCSFFLFSLQNTF